MIERWMAPYDREDGNEYRCEERGVYSVLDHGYLHVKTVWGSDQEIIETARMSTNKGFLGWDPGPCPSCSGVGSFEADGVEAVCHDCNGKGKVPGDAKLLRYLYEHKHCYDAETEVLVKGKGFVRWSDVRETDELGQLDMRTDTLVYERAFDLIEGDYSGEMYRVDHGGVDLLVTPNHKMFVKTIVRSEPGGPQGWAPEWRLAEAQELGDRSMVRYRKHARRVSGTVDLTLFPENESTIALMRLVGFFLGDGFAGGTRANSIEFNIRLKRKVDFLKETCSELGWNVRKLTSAHVVDCQGIGRLFEKLFYDENGEKYVPEHLLDLDDEHAAAMLDGLKNSDGTVKRGAWEYSTTSKKLADAVQRLVIHSGGAAHINGDSYIYRVMVLSRMTEPVVNQGKKNTSTVKYNGKIYCARTRTGVLMVRRNGKPVLSGNSTPFEFAGLTIEVQAPIMVFREWHRHRTASYSEMSARYVQMPNLHYVPSVERIIASAKKSSNKQASGAGVLNIPDEVFADDREIAERVRHLIRAEQQRIYTLYEQLLSFGISKEIARLDTPVSRYSRMRATANLRNWLAFLTLRTAPGAQFEIRQYAHCVEDVIAEVFPRTYELFCEPIPSFAPAGGNKFTKKPEGAP
jgi:thymidylate synthase (FAD)